MVFQFEYPGRLLPEFIETAGLDFRDDRSVTPKEIWHFMTIEAPRRFPYAFSTSSYHINRLSCDVEFLSGIKRGYLTLSLYDRLTEARSKGIPVVFIQGGQTMEPYYAAGGIPARPAFISQWALNRKEGLNLREADLRANQIREESRKQITIEACQTAGYGAIQGSEVTVDLIAPYLCLRCSDVAYGAEAHRHGKRKVPLFLVDFPLDHKGDWAIQYLTVLLRRLTEKISELRGKEVTEEYLRREIRLHNEIRRLARRYAKIWWSAKIPPTNSVDHTGTMQLGNEGYGDPVAAEQILKESTSEVKQRIKDSVKGAGLADEPVRLFICGSCVTPNPNFVDRAGGVTVGKDDGWSEISVDVKENGDPYENLAEAILSYPYEQPTDVRAKWTAEQVKQSRADGVVFMYNWGCNYQTAVARMIADIVKEETGIPSTIIELAELGRLEALEQSQNRVESFIEMLR